MSAGHLRWVRRSRVGIAQRAQASTISSSAAPTRSHRPIQRASANGRRRARRGGSSGGGTRRRGAERRLQRPPRRLDRHADSRRTVLLAERPADERDRAPEIAGERLGQLRVLPGPRRAAGVRDDRLGRRLARQRDAGGKAADQAGSRGSVTALTRRGVAPRELEDGVRAVAGHAEAVERQRVGALARHRLHRPAVQRGEAAGGHRSGLRRTRARHAPGPRRLRRSSRLRERGSLATSSRPCRRRPCRPSSRRRCPSPRSRRRSPRS